MLRKRDLIIIGTAMLLVASFFLASFIAGEKTEPGAVKITVGKEDPVIYPLEENTVTIERDGCVNVIEITGNGVRMAEANCKNHDCIEQGEATLENFEKRAMGRFIICLPNRITIELTEEG